jgi:hypothetical protein
MFRNAAVTKAQLLHVLKSLGWFVIWSERLLEGVHKLLVRPPVGFVGLRFFTFFNFRLDKLLFPNSGISICQIGQNERYFLLVVVVDQSVYFEVNINILHEQDEIALFPCKGFWWVKPDVFRGFWCHRCGCNGFGYSFFLLSVLVSVSRCQVSSSQSLEVSFGQDFVVVGVRCKDTGTFVGKSTLLLDFEMFKAKCLTV